MANACRINSLDLSLNKHNALLSMSPAILLTFPRLHSGGDTEIKLPKGLFHSQCQRDGDKVDREHRTCRHYGERRQVHNKTNTGVSSEYLHVTNTCQSVV